MKLCSTQTNYTLCIIFDKTQKLTCVSFGVSDFCLVISLGEGRLKFEVYHFCYSAHRLKTEIGKKSRIYNEEKKDMNNFLGRKGHVIHVR